ncbi:MAG: putative glycoside hydrolase [Acidimicrobiia bacterium]|nr:MAG: putative glycoside hydrolase [Acidimicrobiia bacterium]
MQAIVYRRVIVALGTSLAVVAASCTGPAPLDVSGVRPPEMGPPTIEIVVLAGDDLSEISAEVTVDGVPLSAGETPVERSFTWPGEQIAVTVSKPGFESWTSTYGEPPGGGRIEVRLEPVILRGRVTTNIGLSLPGTNVRLGAATDVTNDDGLFEIGRAVPGDLELERPAWNDLVIFWDGAIDEIDISMEPLKVIGIRVAGAAPGDAVRWAELLRLAGSTGVNAFVVDIKDEFGTVFHDTGVAEAQAVGAVSAAYDLAEVIQDMDDAGLYKIARIVAFQDTPMAVANPDHAVFDSETGEVWRNNADEAWMDPSDPFSYEYPIALAEEACRAGFDETQFDFASFPIGGSRATAVFDAENNEENRVDSIVQFLERAYSVLNPLGCAVGASVLGITLESPFDEGVGQRPGRMSRVIDVLSPTLYSTNYGPGWKGFEDPDANAVQIVDEALASGMSRLEGFAYIRPWLQTWTVTAEDVVNIQRAAAGRDMGWMLWSNSARYSSEILPQQ